MSLKKIISYVWLLIGTFIVVYTLASPMKNTLLIIFSLTLISCNQLTNEVKSSFSSIGNKLDSLNQVEEIKIERLFKEINSKMIKKNDGENSALIYHSVIKHNRIVDSLILKLEAVTQKNLDKKKVITKFNYIKTNLKNTLNKITGFNTKTKIDSLLKPSDDLEVLSKTVLIAKFQDGKLNATKSATLLLEKIDNKTKSKL